jgi:hypothetical protein
VRKSEAKMTDPLEYVTYCGLYCGLCAERTRIPKQAAALKKAMAEEGWPFWGHTIHGFTGFWEFLEKMDAGGGCPGCRAGGGDPGFQIRICAREREMELCNECTDFPCGYVNALAAAYPTLLADNLRLQAAGLEQWLSEQEERARRGVVYADFRYHVEETE